MIITIGMRGGVEGVNDNNDYRSASSVRRLVDNGDDDDF